MTDSNSNSVNRRTADGPSSAGDQQSVDAGGFIALAVGFGCMLGYVRLASLGFVGYLEQGTVETTDPWYALRAFTMLAVLVALSLLGLFARMRQSAITVMTATACAVAAAILFAVDGSGAMGPIVAVLEGVASAELMYVWALILSRRPASVIVGSCIVGGGITGLMVAFVPSLDDALALVVAVVAAFVAGSAALFADRGLESVKSDGVPTVSELARVPWVTVVMVLASGFLGTAVYGIAVRLAWLHDWSPDYAVFVFAVIATVAATMAIILQVKSWMHVAWVPITVLLAIALGFGCVLMRESMQIALALVLASVFCGRYLYWMVFPAMLSTLRIPRAFIVGMMLTLANGSLAVMAGDAIGAVLPRSMQNLGGVAGIVVLVLVALFALTSLLYRKAYGAVGYWADWGAVPLGTAPVRQTAVGAVTDERIAPDAASAEQSASAVVEEAGARNDEDDDKASAADQLEERVRSCASEYGLTPREIEVAIPTAQGFSCAYIAEKLVVSNSTVRFHQQNIYRKIDVHSRNELIEFFLNDEASDQPKQKD